MPTNQIAKMYADQHNTAEQQFDLIVFLDGNEADKASHVSAENTFLESWKRPKWHIIIAEE